LPEETPVAAVRHTLERLGARVFMLDQRAVLQTEVELSIGTVAGGMVRSRGQEIDLGEVTALYLRPYDTRRLPGVRDRGPRSPAWRHAVTVDEALWTWADLTPALVVNRPSAQATNNSKPYQAQCVSRAGFETPETLITTDPEAVREFWATHHTLVYKSISGVRSIVSTLDVEHVPRLRQVSWCPTQFQRYIPGDDHRVHVVGNHIFACRITSSATDYRYATRQAEDVQIQACEIPPDCAARCKTLVANLGLEIAGVDLRRSPDGAWYCFEVNPSPGFTYYQEASGQPIDEAIARLLAAAKRRAAAPVRVHESYRSKHKG